MLSRPPNLCASPELSYVLGAFYGDCDTHVASRCGKHIRLTVKDRDFVEEFNKCISKILHKESGYPIRVVNYKEAHEVEVNNSGLYKFLNESLEKHKVKIEKFPAPFLRGFYDSEGGAYYHLKSGHRKIYVYNTNYTLMSYIQDILFRHFSIRALLRVHKEKGTIAKFAKKSVARNKHCYALRIHRKRDIAEFSKRIGFSIKRKQIKLAMMLEGVKCVSP